MIKLSSILDIDQDVMFWRNPQRVNSDACADFSLVVMKHESNIDVLTALVEKDVSESGRGVFDFELPAYRP